MVFEETEPYSREWYTKLAWATLGILVTLRVVLGDRRTLVDGIFTYISLLSYVPSSRL